MGEGEGVLGFIGWAIITALSIIALLITIRNGLGPDDAIAGGTGLFSGFKMMGSFFKGPTRRSGNVIYARPTPVNVSYGSLLWRRK